MKRPIFRLSTALVITFVYLIIAVSNSLACGVERWNIKVVQDQHSKYFFQNNDLATGKLQPFLTTTIADLQKQPYPLNVSPKSPPPKWSYDLRAGTAEFRMWTVTAFLTKKKNEKDEDYHLIMDDGTGRSLVAEIPSPNCVAETPEPLKSMILEARSDFDDWFMKQTKKTFFQKVRMTGIGFFDRVHGSEGESPNGIELHPVIKIAFLK